MRTTLASLLVAGLLCISGSITGADGADKDSTLIAVGNPPSRPFIQLAVGNPPTRPFIRLAVGNPPTRPFAHVA